MSLVVYYPCDTSKLESLLAWQVITCSLVTQGLIFGSGPSRDQSFFRRKDHDKLVHYLQGYDQVTAYLAGLGRMRDPLLKSQSLEASADAIARTLASDMPFNMGHEYQRILNALFISCYSFNEVRKRAPQDHLFAFVLPESQVRVREVEQYLIPCRLSFDSLVGILTDPEDVYRVRELVNLYALSTVVSSYDCKQKLFK